MKGENKIIEIYTKYDEYQIKLFEIKKNNKE
jgi:hypothetical protein